MPYSQSPFPARGAQCLVSAVTLLATAFVAGRAAAEPLRLSIDEVVTRAVKSSYQLVAIDKQVAAAQNYLDRSSAWLSSNPTITGGGSASDGKFDTTLPNNQQGPSHRLGPAYTFTVDQSFEVAGQRRLRMDAATRGLEAAQYDRAGTEAVVRADAKKAFSAALESDAKVELAARSAKLIEQVNAGFNLDAHNSDKERIAFNSSTMQLNRQRRRAASAEHDRDEAYRQLKRIAGIPPELQIALEGALESHPRALPSLDELRAGLADRRGDVAAYRSLVARAEADLALAKRSAIPDVSVFGFVSRFDAGDNTETSGGGSLGITLPIFQGNGPSIADAISERQRAGAELDDLVELVDANLVTAYTNTQDAAADLDMVLNEILPRARDNVELQRRRARRGEVDSYDVVDYDVELVTAEEELLTARRAYTDALIELEKAAAVPLVGAAEVSVETPRPTGADEKRGSEN